MHRRNSRLLLSSSDLVAFHDCAHLTQLDLRALDDPELRKQRSEDDEQAKLIQRKGHEFEARYLAHLEATYRDVVRIDHNRYDPERQAAETVAAMRDGAAVVYQATLLKKDLVGHADFLRRVERPSSLGDWSYEVIDTKLARSEKPKFVLQLCFYSELLAVTQGTEPRAMHVVLGTGDETSYRYADYTRYFRRLLQRFRATLGSTDTDATYPDPCERCSICSWRELCEARREQDDSLWLVADIRSSQVKKLQTAGIQTLTRLAKLPASRTIPKLAPTTFAKLRGQAALQLAGREAEKPLFELLAAEDDLPRGFARMPPPDDGDVFFDMEGDPLIEDGLEYLFGVLYRDGAAWKFKALWAHERDEERRAFEQFMDWLAARIERHSALHVYHYAAYENSALKRLSGWHGTREAMLDQLLRDGRLVDLYRVVREAVRVSTPSYSIKDLERLYRDARHGEVQTAGASIVWYERWLQTREQSLLDDIERYNEDDCRSLEQLHEWLVRQRPRDLSWAGTGTPDEPGAPAVPRPIRADIQAYLDGVRDVRTCLQDSLPKDPTTWEAPEHARAIVADLLEFQRRNEKPKWWEMFARVDMTFDELIDTPEAIAGLRRAKGTADTFEYPPQEIKFRDGDKVVWLDNQQHPTITVVKVDEDRCRVRLAPTRRSGPLPDRLNVGASGPIQAQVLKEAVLRVGRSMADGDHRYPALEAFLQKRLPRLAGRPHGTPIVADPSAPADQIIEAVFALDRSHLFIQGPPGAGKTWTGSQVIVELLKRGKRVAVSSNSHKAINNLLAAVDEIMANVPLNIPAAKKSTEDDPDSCLNGHRIEDVFEAPTALKLGYRLVGGTAWLFARAEADQAFDYLFVDEAGQVSLGHLLAMATCARNVVLLGDQMQLGQPIQGVHPGRSGESALDFLLDGRATVAPAAGIFLPTTWRMCPDVCRFISEVVYDGRLQPEPLNANQRLLLARSHHPALRPTGVMFLPMEHTGCSQRSAEEAQAVRAIYDDLIVAPYNMQVNLLKRTLPPEARVGTVDKFQGQEAAVVLVSMTTSSEDDLPRHIEFLFSKNRLNVAISRARCLSVVLANPRLLDTRCRTVKHVMLVNTLTWAAENRSWRPRRCPIAERPPPNWSAIVPMQSHERRGLFHPSRSRKRSHC